MDKKEILRFVAEAPVTEIDEQESNSVYMTVTMRMMSTLKNSNGHVVKKDFIDEIIENQSWYVGTPVKGDVERLVAGLTTKLGHKFNKKKREYMTQQIGSIMSFEAVEENGETVLYGTARIEKSSIDLCTTIAEMFSEGKLFFSFEILAAKVTRDGDLVYIGADRDNRLTAMCIVSIPAYKEAKAIRLVASLDEEMIKNIEGLTQWVAELEIDGVRTQLYALLYSGDNPLFGWDWDIREFGVDYLLLKKRSTGDRVMIKYTVVDDKVEITENYPVVLAPATTPVSAEKVEKEEEKEEAAKCNPEDEEKKNAEDSEKHAEEDKAIAEETLKAEEMKAEEEKMELEKELAELRTFKAEAEKKELAEKKASLKSTVEKAGLKAEDLAAEIENLEYEKIMPLIAEKLETKAPAQVVTLVAEDGLGLKANKWAGLVSDPTGL